MERLELPGHDLVGIRADNPGPFTLTGTNTWIVGRDPAWLIDPGPRLGTHVAAVTAELDRRGGLGGIALTHDHADHAEAVPALREAHGAAVAAARGSVDVRLGEGSTFGPLRVLSAPGHAADHLVFIYDRIGFSGDAVLGQGSVFISPDPGALTGYLRALRRLADLDLAVLCPGHGPPIHDVSSRVQGYIAHRLDRERRLLQALTEGRRSTADLLDEVWDDAPPALRPAAAVTLAAHLDKLREEGRLPPGVERPGLPPELRS